jgi:tape measure domain-containing protein
MAEQVGEIYYTVDFQTEQMTRKVPQAEKALDQLDQGFKKTDRSASQLNSGLSGLAKAISAVIAASALRDMARLVQSYQEMAERVQMATSSQAEYEMVQKRLLATANGTYRNLAEAQELFIRTNASLQSLGYNTGQALDVMDSLSYSFVTNATSADRANAAITAVSKAFNTGKVSVDQWETITAAIPSIIEQVATASGKGADQIRLLGSTGKLTARDLSEGLRKSLETNSEAADKMAVNLTDAGVRMRTALQITLVALEEQTGALQTFTDTLVSAADMMIEFAGSAGGVETIMTAVSLAATSTAAVIAGRLVMSLSASAAGFYASTIAAGAKARADLAAAQAAAAAAAQELILAAAAERAAVGLSTHAAAATRLAAAQATATAATTTLAAAQQRMAGVATIATTALTGLRTVMAFLGGPVGIALLAAGAIFTFATRAREAKAPTDDLTKSVRDLTDAQRELAKFEASERLQKLGEEAKRLARDIEGAAALMKRADVSTGTDQFQRALAERRVELEKVNGEIQTYAQRLKDLQNYQAPATPTGGNAPGEPAAPTTTPDGQKRLQQMRDEIELAKLTGEARARLQAIQRLGADATDEERAEAEKLATTLYNLEEAQKRAKGGREQLTDAQKDAKQAEDDLARAQESDAKTLADLQEALYQTTLTTEQLRDRKAELSLSSYATPEQIEEVKRLNAELAATEELQKRRASFGEGDVRSQIVGNVSPLSGGQFDNQQERYEAERKAEEQRYAEQQQRLTEALELQLVTKEEYQALELEMYQAHSDRLYQIDKARTEMQLQAWAQGFGEMSRNLSAFATQFADENNAMFKVAKAAAVAQAIINTYQAATGAMASMSAIPIVGPALGIAAAAAAVAGGMAQVAAIRSQSAPGRLYGGPVQAGGAYRINENGAPEVYQAANGRQYMLPNSRGEVISNADATGQGGGYGQQAAAPITVNQTVNVTGEVSRYTAKQLARKTEQQQRVARSRLG